jgi:hypothetical protein
VVFSDFVPQFDRGDHPDPISDVIGKLKRGPCEFGPYFKIESCIAGETWTVCVNPHQRVAGYLQLGIAGANGAGSLENL